MAHSTRIVAAATSSSAKSFLSVFAYSRRALELVWSTSRSLTFAIAVLTLIAGALPAGIAFVGARIVDAVVTAMQASQPGATRDVLEWVVFEGVLVALLAAAQRGMSLCQSLLRAQLGQRVNVMILEKALTLDLAHFEDSDFYDKLTRARREASSRPLSLVMRTFGLIQHVISLVSYGVLLVQFSPWAVVILIACGLPAFLAEVKFSGDAFRLFRWRSPETRMQMYLETVIAREDHAKEVKLFGLGPLLLDRYRQIYNKLYKEDRDLTIRRDAWGFLLSLLGTIALYAAYAWIALSAVAARITLGAMTMYLMLFRQGQSAVSAGLAAIGGMYEDNLYLSTLYEYLETPVAPRRGAAIKGPQPEDGIRFENVTFTYPEATAMDGGNARNAGAVPSTTAMDGGNAGNAGAALSTQEPALRNIDLHIKPGESLALVGENGSGKTTLIKLLTRLYSPTAGRILLDGLDLVDWDAAALQARIGVIFQDFARYQLKVGENVGAGDVRYFGDEAKWRDAADKGMAASIIEQLPQGFNTQLGKWFREGRELSGGQWQKIALARAFMRSEADVLVLDEPTASMDAAAEATIFEHFQKLTHDKIAILISHRFSTVRMASQIVVIEQGKIIERGSHEDLMKQNGHYAHLFSLQARGYK
ncbi:MAG: ABC transporter ATP-binding protein [Candidatus Obscuribacterales bacterium]|nr:ABC transporter ATP-binding protein [Steroidobacteraceae bacterium]